MASRNQHGWTRVPLSAITTKIGSGLTPLGGKESYKEVGISLIRSLNVYDFQFDFDDLAHIDEEQAKQLSHVNVQADDILLNITGASVARCCMVPATVLPARVNQHVSIVRVSKSLADPHFVFYSINSPGYKGHLLTLAQGGATREALTKATIENFQIALPPLTEQCRIGSILSAYDNLIENNTRRIKILEQMAHMLYREWFVNFRFPGHEKVKTVKSEFGLIPQGWKLVSYSEIIESTLGGDWGSEECNGEDQAPVRAVRGTDFDDLRTGNALRVPRRFVSEASLRKRKLAVGDIVVENSVNAKTRCAGSSLLVTEGMLNRLGEDAIAASFCRVFRPKNKKMASIMTLHMQRLHREGGMSFYQNVAANGIANFQTTRFLETERIGLPSALDDLNPLLEKLEPFMSSNPADRIHNLRATRDLLLPKLVSGEINVEEIEAEVPAQTV